jgi:plasmid stabilization system protein ParE
MRLVLHPKVHSDIDMIMDYYEEVATPELASEFYAELRHLMTKAAGTTRIFFDSSA